MRRTLPTVVMVLALALCALCVVQWVRESGLRRQLLALAEESVAKDRTIAGLEGRLRTWEAEIQRLTARVEELKVLESTNSVLLAESQRVSQDAVKARDQVAVYERAFEAQNENLKRQNESIARQNAAIEEQNTLLRKLAEERDHIVEQLNNRTRAYNDLVGKYNELVKRLEADAAR